VPGHRLIFANLQQQIELLGEELVVVRQRVAEQGKRLGERPSAYHQFGPSIGQQIEGDEVLEYPDRICRTEHDDRARQLDRLRATGDCRKNDFRSRRCHVGPVMLADGIDLEAEFVGELGLLNHLP
jgi:hypothetical protein